MINRYFNGSAVITEKIIEKAIEISRRSEILLMVTTKW